MVLGSTTILISVFAGRELYEFFTPITGLAIMFLSTVSLGLAGVIYKNKYLAFLGLVLAGVAPLLTGGPTLSHIAVFNYLLLIVAGIIWVAWWLKSSDLSLAGLFLTAIYSFPYLSEILTTGDDLKFSLPFIYLLAVLFLITTIINILRITDIAELRIDLSVIVGTGLLLLFWIMIAVPVDWRSFILLAWMLVFAVIGLGLYWRSGKQEVLLTCGGVATVMLAFITGLEASSELLIVFYTLEAFLLSLITLLILKSSKIAGRVGLLLAGPIFMSLNSMNYRLWPDHLWHWDFGGLAILALVLVGLAGILIFYSKTVEKQKTDLVNYMMLVVGSVYFYILLWLSTHALLVDKDVAVMLSLFVYTVIGLAFYFQGVAVGWQSVKIYGGLLIGFVIGRLLFIDVWGMDLTGRIIIFFLIGILLISTAFWIKEKPVNKNSV
ncbi:MAG: DUF2339 domain-containing protein [Patescibacteria group bacterium]